MSDEIVKEPELQFEEAPEEEYVILKAGEEIPEEEPATPEPFADTTKAQMQAEIDLLKGQTDPVSAMTEGIAKLGEQLRSPQAQPVQPKEKDPILDMPDTEFTSWFNKEIFGDNPMKAYDARDRRVAAKSPKPSSNSPDMLTMAKMIGLNGDRKDFIGKYMAEIDSMISQANPEQRANAGTFDQILNLVKMNHIDEIIADEVTKAQGATSKPIPNPNPKTFTETGSRPSPKNKRVYIPDRVVQLAARKGMPVEQFIRTECNRLKKDRSKFLMENR